jgi:ATP-dependent Clp protease adaptor protein ClpS
MPQVIDRPDTIRQEQEAVQAPWIVRVFNNDINTYQQVMSILMLATRCSAEEAYMEAWEIDHLGSSVVHQATEGECRTAAKVISTIGIRVEVMQE